MRAVAAALLTTVAPTLVGFWIVAGGKVGRLALGSLLGITAMVLGGVAGAVVGHGMLLPGAVLGLIVLAVLGPRHRPTVNRLTDRPLLVAVCGLLALGAVFLASSVFRPVPQGDAWTIWSLKALASFHSGNLSGPVFTSPSYLFSHQDYPPWLPTWQALAFRIEGKTTPSWPTQFQLAWLWMFGATALLTSIPFRPVVTLVTAAAWLCTPVMLGMVLSGQADAPSALLLVVGTAVLLKPKPAWRAGTLLLAGAALTKNEGTLEALAVPISLVIFYAARQRAVPWRTVVSVLVPVGVCAAIWSALIRARHLSNDALNWSQIRHMSLAQLPSRSEVVLRTMASHLLDVGLWGLAVGLTVGCLLRRPVHWGLLLAAGLSFGAMLLRYVASPYQLAWDLRYSIDRITAAPLGLLALAGIWAVAGGLAGAGTEPDPLGVDVSVSTSGVGRDPAT